MYPAAYVRTGGATDLAAAGSTRFDLNTWTHVAATYDGATVRLFVNGTEVISAAAPGELRTSANPLRLGGNAVWGEWFAGLLDEVRIYNRALSVVDIYADMNTPVSDPLRVTAVSATPSTNGVVSLTSGIITYQPAADFSGAASFDYTVCDSGTTNGVADNKCASGTVNVTVTPANGVPVTSP